MLPDPQKPSRSLRIQRWIAGLPRRATDTVVVEEPLEIRINNEPFAITMRTPGDDAALAAGFLATEGILRDRDDIWDITRCGKPHLPEQQNVVTVFVPPDCAPTDTEVRQRYATASCGLCGRGAIEAVRTQHPRLDSPLTVSSSLLYALPGRLRDAQQLFSSTGGLHAAGLFDAEGKLLFAAEDVGRHNAVDKVAGLALLADRWPLDECILVVSGRAGFEIVQKALAARIPIVCSVSAPSSLAVELAREAGMTLAGFLRGETMNVYAGAERITS